MSKPRAADGETAGAIPLVIQRNPTFYNQVNSIRVLDTFNISSKSLPYTGPHHEAQNPQRSLSKLTLELLSWEEDDKR